MLSVDAVGAFDHVSRGAMLTALYARPELQPLLPFARQFYADPSTYTWYDNDERWFFFPEGPAAEPRRALRQAPEEVLQGQRAWLCRHMSEDTVGQGVPCRGQLFEVDKGSAWRAAVHQKGHFGAGRVLSLPRQRIGGGGLTVSGAEEFAPPV